MVVSLNWGDVFYINKEQHYWNQFKIGELETVKRQHRSPGVCLSQVKGRNHRQTLNVWERA